MPCVWVQAYEGSRRMRGGAQIATLLPPIDQRLKGSSAWLRAARGASARRHDDARPAPARHRPRSRRAAGRSARPFRSRGRLERVLRRGEFAVTAELNPPDSANAEDVYERAQIFEGWVDGINATDGSGAHCHMSSVAICALLTRVGYSPVLQISCRDYNRIAIQGNVLGAAALEVGNILCLTGDGVQCGDHPEAKPVFDLDFDLAAVRSSSACATRATFLSGPQDHDAAARLPRRRGEPVRAALRFPRRSGSPRRSPPGAQFVPDAILLRPVRVLAALHGEGARHGARPSAASSWSASARSPRPRRRAGCAPTSPASISPTPSSRASKAPRTSRPRASASASR